MGYIIKQQAFHFFDYFPSFFILMVVLKPGPVAITEQHPSPLFKASIREVHTLDLLEQRIFDIYLFQFHIVYFLKDVNKKLIIKW